MSVSSGSDITIPIQDSPPPPPSPYANNSKRTSGSNDNTMSSNKSTGESSTKTPEPRGDIIGIDNVAYQSETGNGKKEAKGSAKKGNNTTSIDINGYNSKDAGSPINEAVNGEIINMSVLDTIPHKPQPEFGPYENFDEYFIAVNQHKKFLRGEKLYVTKDKRKSSRWKKYVCWLFGALMLAAIITMSILAAVGLFPPKSSPNQHAKHMLGMSTTTTQSPDLSSSEISSFSSSSEFPAPESPVSDNYVPYTADVHLTLNNEVYEEALADPSSEQYRRLADTVETELKKIMETDGNLNTAYVRVTEFSSGSVVVKLRVSWMDSSKDLSQVQRFLSTLRKVGEFDIRPGTTSYALLNNCKMGNNGCSNFCTFDYEALDFYCTCPERMILGSDNKTCREPDQPETSSEGNGPEVVASSAAPAPIEPEHEHDHNDTTSAESQPQPSEEPVVQPEPEPSPVPTVPSGEESQEQDHQPSTNTSVETGSAVDHDMLLNETAIPTEIETTPRPIIPDDENVSLINDTVNHPAPDFDYSTEDIELVTPELSSHHHDKAPIIALTTTTEEPRSMEVIEIHPTVQSAFPDQPAIVPIVHPTPDEILLTNDTRPESEESDEGSIAATIIPEVVADSSNEDSIATTVITPFSEEAVDQHHEHSANSSEIVSTIDITPRHSSVEAADDVPPTIQTIDEEPAATHAPESEPDVELVEPVNEQRNSSVTRALLKNYESLQEVHGNSNENQEQYSTETPAPHFQSDEFMAYSDANMSLVNANLTPKTESDTTELPSGESIASYENHSGSGSGGVDASVSVSGEEIPAVVSQSEEVADHQQSAVATATTTIKPFSLVNDTAVNHMTDGVTEDLVNSEAVSTMGSLTEAESVTEAAAVEQEIVMSQESGPSAESASAESHATESPAIVPDNHDHEQYEAITPIPETSTTIHPAEPSVNEWTRSVADLITKPFSTTTTPSSAESNLDPQPPSIVTTTIDILRRNLEASTPHPNPYNVLSNTFSQFTTNSSSPDSDEQHVNDNQNSGNELI